jgi:hypothetical protein
VAAAMAAAGQGVVADLRATQCHGKSAGLPAAQCNATLDLYDAAGGRKWKNCTRHSPCDCVMFTCALDSGTVYAVRAFGSPYATPDYFLDGTLPASLSAFVYLDGLNLRNGNLTGKLPALPFDNFYMISTCDLGLLSMHDGLNKFDCPFPDGVTKKCVNSTGKTHVKATDCTPTTPTPPTPAPAQRRRRAPPPLPPTPSTFLCEQDTGECHENPGGFLPEATCEASCKMPVACTGMSQFLPKDQCDAWQKLYAGTGGARWKQCNDSATDPCACYRRAGRDVYSPIGVVCYGLGDNEFIAEM